MNLILIQSHELDDTQRVRIVDERAEHIRRVLCAPPGKVLRIGLLNGPKGSGTVEEVDRHAVVLQCTFETHVPERPQVDLLLAMPRPKVMKRLWSQLAALGVGRIFLTNAEKVERYYFDSHVMESEFYTAQLMEGLQQAGDTLLPDVRIVRQLKPFLETELDSFSPRSGSRWLADPSGRKSCGEALDGLSGRVLLAIGPEGGWTPYELELFSTHHFYCFHAGSRILRTDTACVGLVLLFNQKKEQAFRPALRE